MNSPSALERPVRMRVVDGATLDEVAVTVDGGRLLRMSLDVALLLADELTLAVERARRRAALTREAA